MKRHQCTLLCLALSAASLFYCTNLDVAGGSSSTDNGRILGMICLENGLPAPNTQVTLRPADFDPYQEVNSPRIDTTGAAGDYEFTRLAPGVYTMEAVAIDTRTRALVSPVTVDSSTAYAPVASLARPGALRIQVHTGSASAARYVYIPGTSRFAMVSNGSGFIDSVPAGTIPAVCYINMADPAAIHTVKTDFTLDAGATRVIADYSAWNHSKRLFLNTSINGADVSGMVLDFPVLVRLSGANFDFGQTNGNGSDLRFKKPDDSPLAFEIERWDPAVRKAEIWVRVDTVYGNDNQQSFAMYWGNAAAASASNSAVVFDTAAGFEGVWHLSGTGTATAHDATANNYHGTPYNMTVTSAVEGAVGTALVFNGSSSYIAMQNTAAGQLDFPEDGVYSMSLWAYTDTIDTIWHAIAGKGHEQYYMQLKCFGNNRATWEFVEFQNNRGWEYTEDSVPPSPGARQWLHLVGVRSGTSQRLYINGEKVIDTASLMEGVYARNTGDNFTIGRYGRPVQIPYYQGWSYFKGRIDEVRVSRGALSADWIKLCYMNQKPDDALIVFGQ
ncbi:MAG: DUF2341 domain-containing protein [Chitinispirillaceae bacterium]|nr:DUF2341 domain-containing protein [Chitinispirillaceae bacterium]